MIYFWLVVQQSIASMTHIIGQDAVHALDPGLVLLFRSSIAAIGLCILITIREKRFALFADLSRRELGRIVILGALNVLINQQLYLEGLRHTTSANSALLYALTPAMVFLFAIRVHWEHTNWKKIVGIAIAFIGTAILMFEHGASLSSEHTLGNIEIFLAVIAWSLFTLLGRPLVLKYGALKVTAQHMTVGALLFLPFGLAKVDSAAIAAINTTLWLQIIYLGLIASCVNYVLWYYALGKLQTSKVAIFQNLQPVLTTTIAVILGRAILSSELVGGGILALAGVLLVQFG